MTIHQTPPIYIGNTQKKSNAQRVSGEFVERFDDTFYCIRNYDALAPFFMTLVSSSNHWLFISTTGGLSAGRVDSDHALFPYYTVDKITENSENTGSKTIMLVATETGQALWEPFSERNAGVYQLERNLYKNVLGTTLIFEEINHDLDLTYRYAWRTSDAYGFVKTSYLVNHGQQDRQIHLLDGLQNILPAHVSVDVQNSYSNLLDAYKFNELQPATGLGLFSLSSRLTDLAEPSESLRTNVVWQAGLTDVTHLLSSAQLSAFRNGEAITQEQTIRGKRGAYFVSNQVLLDAGAEQSWHIVADVEQDHAHVVALLERLRGDVDDLRAALEQDIQRSQQKLDHLMACADSKQQSSDTLSTAHHLANVLFNTMRGGIFADHYQIERKDLKRFIGVHKPALLTTHATFFDGLAAHCTISDLHAQMQTVNDADLTRLLTSYLPLTFSRRHGDPSRPWNAFQINVTHPDGSQRLDYQGNWRDIFQNWEALSYSYPEFIHGMISVFLNATTADGYNPYRVTRDGIDWEVPEPDNPWANIGYWNDHQIIYLQKLLEACDKLYPNALQAQLNRRIYSYANVPYRIKPYAAMLKNPYATIDFDWDQEEQIEQRVADVGVDGKLVHDASGAVVHGSLAEKLLLLLLTKLTNFVPEGGIWLNTQRPEWNDANNALVGKGLSVVTLGYMRRYIAFFTQLLKTGSTASLHIAADIAALLEAVHSVLGDYQAALDAPIDDPTRRTIMDRLGQAGSAYRSKLYDEGFSTATTELASADVIAFLEVAQQHVEHALQANKRDDDLYHAYNVLHLSNGAARVNHLSLMLEGQVSIVSSGLLSADEALTLLQALRQSDLYREDQHSYMLYPNRYFPRFLEKNIISAEQVADSQLVAAMHAANDTRLLSQDVDGNYHFQGDIRNAEDVAAILDTLEQESAYAQLVTDERQPVLDLFESVFNHAAFTGRSGTFFAYEGLGSIYWHMVSKLLLAVQEAVLDAGQADAPQATIDGLRESYEDIRAGIGFNKAPDVYGAFPTDPYSHSPLGAGAKQPGMTGMVKEEILTRLTELGIVITDGEITYDPILLRKQEWLDAETAFEYTDLQGANRELLVPAGGLAFTICQVPIVMQPGNETYFEVHHRDGTVQTIRDRSLGTETSQAIFSRDDSIQHVVLVVAN